MDEVFRKGNKNDLYDKNKHTSIASVVGGAARFECVGLGIIEMMLYLLLDEHLQSQTGSLK